jgi:DNA replication protein DnaC
VQVKLSKRLAMNVKSKKPYIVCKLKNLDILIIDEISMINNNCEVTRYFRFFIIIVLEDQINLLVVYQTV